MGEFSELRICAEELLKKADELETAFNNINKAKQNETDRVVKRVKKYNNETNNHAKNLTLDLSRKTNGLRICNEVTLNIVENLAKALKIHVYFLAFLVLVFVISEIYAC
jgi:hypothetical protein